MKLTGVLKDKVKATDTLGEKKNVIVDAGMELTDDELNYVAGGEGFDDCKICGNCYNVSSSGAERHYAMYGHFPR